MYPKLFDSFSHIDSEISILQKNSVISKDDNTARERPTNQHSDGYRKKRRRCCAGVYRPCCCILVLLLMLLLIAGLAALLVFLLENKSKATTSTSTTSTISTSTTTTTELTTTPLPPCAPTSVGSVSVLYSTTTSSSTAYACHAFEWTASSTTTVTLSFELRHDPFYWYVDDVSVYSGSTQKLVNGDFESGFSPWVRTAPNGACGSFPATSCGTSPRTGSGSLCDGSFGCADRVSQSFSVTAGEVLVVSFWMRSGGSGSGIVAIVTLS